MRKVCSRNFFECPLWEVSCTKEFEPMICSIVVLRTKAPRWTFGIRECTMKKSVTKDRGQRNPSPWVSPQKRTTQVEICHTHPRPEEIPHHLCGQSPFAFAHVSTDWCRIESNPNSLTVSFRYAFIIRQTLLFQIRLLA